MLRSQALVRRRPPEAAEGVGLRLASMESSGSKERRRAARALVATYHEAELAGLLEHVAEAIERYPAGELDAHDVDEVIHQYTKAARELWKFCVLGGSGSHVESLVATLEQLTAEGDRPDWWARGETHRRR